jgi:hypothetical protein
MKTELLLSTEEYNWNKPSPLIFGDDAPIFVPLICRKLIPPNIESVEIERAGVALRLTITLSKAQSTRLGPEGIAYLAQNSTPQPASASWLAKSTQALKQAAVSAALKRVQIQSAKQIVVLADHRLNALMFESGHIIKPPIGNPITLSVITYHSGNLVEVELDSIGGPRETRSQRLSSAELQGALADLTWTKA